MMASADLIACHMHGCCIMQKCIDAANAEQRKALTITIARHTRKFVKDAFANYVIQYILDLKIPEVGTIVGQQLLGQLLALSKEKFSSNVIEKCLEGTDPAIRAQMVDEIMKATSFKQYLADQYGNYVIQKAIQVALEPKKRQFLELLKPEMAALASSGNFGFKIYGRLVKQYPILNSPEVDRHQFRQNNGGNNNFGA